jgi:hypothetical protein
VLCVGKISVDRLKSASGLNDDGRVLFSWDAGEFG